MTSRARRRMRFAALALLATLSIAAAAADFIAPAGYEQQFRAMPDAPPGGPFLLGADELGRDRLARLLHGVRVSLLVAPATAALATAIALALGLAAAHFPGRADVLILMCTDVVGAVPLLFLLIAARAALPLDVPATASIGITFALLGLCGWSSGVRVMRAAALQVRGSDYMRQAAAAGCRWSRLMRVHAAAAIRPVVAAQFCIFVPHFLMAEASLGALGLGIVEPTPSLGNLLADLMNYAAVAEAPWRLAPALVLVTLLACMQVILHTTDARS